MKYLFYSLIFLCRCAHTPYIILNGHEIKQCMTPVIIGSVVDAPNIVVSAVQNSVLYWNSIREKPYFVNLDVVPFTIDDPLNSGFVPIGVADLDTACAHTDIVTHTNGCIARATIKISNKCLSGFERLETIVRHELGHVLGMRDSIIFTSLMFHELETSMQHPVDLGYEEITAIYRLYE